MNKTKRSRPEKEQTFISIKPDGIGRHLIGEIISRFEKRGLKLVAAKLILLKKEHIEKIYPNDDSWLIPTGKKRIKARKSRNQAVEKTAREAGLYVRSKLVQDLQDKPVLAMVWEGAHAVELGRKTVGSTNPLTAASGTIRGDFTVESYYLADEFGHAVRNLVHASGDKKEAEKDISIFFQNNEIIDYPLVAEEILYGNNWGRKTAEA